MTIPKSACLAFLAMWFLVLHASFALSQSEQQTPFTAVRMWLRYDVQLSWNTSAEAKERFVELSRRPEKATAIRSAADQCVKNAERIVKEADRAESIAIAHSVQRDFYSALTTCLTEVYTVQGVLLVDSLYVDMNQCAGPEEGCYPWTVQFLEWARIRDHVMTIAKAFEEKVNSSRTEFRTAAAIFGALGGFIVGHQIGMKLDASSIRARGLGFQFATADMSGIASLISPTFALSAAAIAGYIGDFVAQQITYAIYKDTFEGFRKAQELLVFEETRIQHALGKERVVDLSPGFLKSLRSALPVSLASFQVDSPQPSDPRLFWISLFAACRSADVITLAQQGPIDVTDANGSPSIQYVMVDYAAPVCDLLYQPLRGYAYILNIEGRSYRVAQTGLVGVGWIGAGLNAIPSMINAANRGMLPEIDTSATRFNEKVEFDLAQSSYDLQELGIPAELWDRKTRARLESIPIRFQSDPRNFYKMMAEAMWSISEGSLISVFYLYRPQRYSTSAAGREEFAAAFVKAYGRWFAKQVIDRQIVAASSDPQVKALINQDAQNSVEAMKFVEQWDLLIEQFSGELKRERRTLLAIDSSRWPGAFQAALAALPWGTGFSLKYREYRQKDGAKRLLEDQLQRDIQYALMPLADELNRRAGVMGKEIMGARHPADWFWASTTFKKSLFILDRSIVNKACSITD